MDHFTPPDTAVRARVEAGGGGDGCGKMLQNLGWATGYYNLVAVPVAAGALAWAGITLARPSAPS